MERGIHTASLSVLADICEKDLYDDCQYKEAGKKSHTQTLMYSDRVRQ